MSDPPLTEAPSPNTNPSIDFYSLSIPPLDPQFLSAQNHPTSSSDDLDFVLDDNCEFDLSFDDFDDLYFPSENESFFLPSENHFPEGQFDSFASDVDRVSCFPHDPRPDVVKVTCTASPESGSSGVSGNRALVDVDLYLNYSSPQNSGNLNSNSNSNGCDREFSGGPVLSQGSDNCGSGVLSETTNAPSTESDNLVVDQKVKVEEASKINISKRKKENEEVNNESRSSKYLRSSLVNENVNGTLSEDETKRRARLMRNRESAQLSRQRKKHYVEELEDKVRTMHSTIADLNGKVSFLIAENATLRQQLCGGNAMLPPGPHMGMHPPPHMTPMPYGWMPCAAAYTVKPQGSQVPLVPIPRLKPQQAAALPKAKKSDGSKTKRDSSRTKKVASVSFLGLLCFLLLFGGLVPFVDVKYGVMRDGVSDGYFSGGSYDQHSGRVLTVNGYSNWSHENMGIRFSQGRVDIGNRIECERGVETQERVSQPSPCSDEFVSMGNASEPLVASLYVPRNDKLVKIDGNLIIHSVLASDKAMASRDISQANNIKETALAIPDVRGNGARLSHLYGNPAERQRAISSGSADVLKDHMKPTSADGKLQQWFKEGLAGPLLSSGMCNEVFQFDVSPTSAPGAIIPAASVANITVEHRRNGTQVISGKNRRILHRLPDPLNRSNLNVTGEHVEQKSQKDSFQGNKTASSMVVSVLVDPREAGERDINGMITPKSLSRIFVVVLLDSVKYVTYSCVLPRSGVHLVTT